MDKQQDKLVNIQALPAPEVKQSSGPTSKQSKPKGRPRLTEEQKQAKRVAKGLPPIKDKITLTKGKKRALEKARVVKQLKAEYRHTTDEKRKNELAVSINAIPFNRSAIPLANTDLKKKIAYANPSYKEESLEDYLLDQNPTTYNVKQPEESNMLYKWSDSQQQQSLWSNKLSELETKMNSIDNYLSKIRVLSGEGNAADYGNPQNIKQNHYIQPHNQHMTPHNGPTDPSPFVSVPFRSSLVAKSRKKP